MTQPLKQTISVLQGTALYVGAVLGSGILILPGMTAGIAGSNALVSWIIMVLLSIPLACTFAFLSIDFPSSGGILTFTDKAFGHYAGAICGWFFFIAGSVGQIIVSLTGGTYIAFAFNLPHFSSYIIASILLSIAVIGNYVGLQTSGKIQLVLAGLTLLILLGTSVLAFPVIDHESITPRITKNSIIPIGQSAMLIFWSFFGWEAISSLAPEFKSPRKQNIMRSTWGAIVIIGVLYIGIALAVIGTNSYSTGEQTVNSAMNNASIAQVVEKVAGVNGAWATAILAFIICLGTNNAFVASMSRLGYSLSHKRLAPSWLDNMNKKYSTPSRAVLLVGTIAGIGLLFSFIFRIGLDELVFIPNSLAIATYIFGTAAGVRLITNVFGKFLAVIACLLCLAAYPFIGSFIAIPIIVALSCIGYITWRSKRERNIK
ncbi:amino acid permease [Bacillus atrophaeus]|uniref:APC family permease n=1 Tax=Bacillus atrophaeus TaxID=1452 RepID=UPI00227DC52F|nr:amino acid permease [Bacillus atrophaeus]MCY8484873.1 amino acid permease [Bacillus atrophaeus]